MEAACVQPAEVARLLGITLSKLGNWTRGDNYPDEYLLTVFCDRYGVTMDYLYRGIILGLPSALADGLAAARAASQASPSVAERPAGGKRRAASNS